MPNKSSKAKFFLGGLLVYLLSAGLTYGILAKGQTGTGFTSPLSDKGTPGSKENPNRKALIEVAGNKTETCPLNGLSYTKAEKNIWETRRPLLVMIENHEESRPQSGLSDSDIV